MILITIILLSLQSTLVDPPVTDYPEHIEYCSMLIHDPTEEAQDKFIQHQCHSDLTIQWQQEQLELTGVSY